MHELSFIVWNPDSTIIDFGFVAIRWYSLLFSSGFVISYFILKNFEKDKIDLYKLDVLTVYMVLATIIGARLGHCLFYDFDYYSKHILEVFLPIQFYPEFKFIGFRGLASHGGAIGILIALVLYT